MGGQAQLSPRALATRTLPVLAALALAPLAAQLATPSHGAALAHARLVRDSEAALGLFFEPALTEAVVGASWAAAPTAVVYLLAHLPVAVAVLGWVLLQRPGAWPVVSATFVATQAITTALNTAWPCAPPSRLGVYDLTGDVWGESAIAAAQQLQSPVAAMPSGHVAWALVAGGALVWLADSRWLRAAGVLWPALTVAMVLGTGNHFWLDAVAAVPVVALALGSALVARSFVGRRSSLVGGSSAGPGIPAGLRAERASPGS